MSYLNDTILLIEDDADDAEMTLSALSKFKFSNLLHLDDGATALEYLFAPGTAAPAVILLDLKMPKVDGIEILGRLKADRDRKLIPVVALISSKEGKKYVESFQLSPDGYLLKPVEGKHFISVLTEIGLSHLACSPFV
jgi:two-component system, response regulator